MKNLFLLLSVFFVIQTLNAQQQNSAPGNEIDYSDSQIAGFTLIGLGAGAIAYPPVAINPPDHPNAYYITGGAMAAAGICFLIFGDKEKNEPKYWKGMSRKGFRKNKNYLSFTASVKESQ